MLGLLSLISGCGLIRSQADFTTPAGAPLAVPLPANFSTGYRWVLDPPLQSASVISDEYTSAKKDLPGSPGTQTFSLLFPREGRFTLKFAYRRLWEPSSTPPVQRTNLVIQVLPAKDGRSLVDKIFVKDNAPDSNVPLPEEEQPQTTTRRVEIKKSR